MLGRLYISSGLGTPQSPAGGARKRSWGVTHPRMGSRKRMDVWMDIIVIVIYVVPLSTTIYVKC